MRYEFKLPDLGEGITEGEVVKWHVKEGDEVFEHQVVMDVETDKAIVEVPSPRKGRVVKLNSEEGAIVAVGQTLLTLEVEGQAGQKETEAARADNTTEKETSGADNTSTVVGKLPAEEGIFAAPKARALAKKLNIDLAKVKGTGPGGIITEKDVSDSTGIKGAPSKPVALKESKDADRFGAIETRAIKGIRRTIAKNLVDTLRNTASVTGMDEADVTDLWELRAKEHKAAGERGVHLTFLPFFIKAVQHALAQHPILNASVDETGENIIIKRYYNIGVAVDTPDGLMVPVIKDVGSKTILQLAEEIQEVGKKAHDRKIKLEELKGSTFTISNYGSYGGTFATPIINSPDVAILGTGKIVERPWVKDGAIVPRKILSLSLTFDHRVTDGAEAAKFLTRVVGYLEDPALIFIESA